MRGDELPLRYRLLLATYPWRRLEPVPRATATRPSTTARVALVTTAGLVPQGETPFDLGRRGGDPSFRILAHDAPPGTLAVHHRSDAFDRTSLERDLNVVFPRQVLDDLVGSGRIGSAAPRHLSFMGSITAPGRLLREVAPRAAGVLREDEVDVAVLVPV